MESTVIQFLRILINIKNGLFKPRSLKDLNSLFIIQQITPFLKLEILQTHILLNILANLASYANHISFNSQKEYFESSFGELPEAMAEVSIKRHFASIRVAMDHMSLAILHSAIPGHYIYT